MGRRMRKKEEREECWDEEDRETFYESREGRKPPDPDYRSQAILSFTTGRLRSHTQLTGVHAVHPISTK